MKIFKDYVVGTRDEISLLKSELQLNKTANGYRFEPFSFLWKFAIRYGVNQKSITELRRYKAEHEADITKYVDTDDKEWLREKTYILKVISKRLASLK